jgi:hypothetical protein
MPRLTAATLPEKIRRTERDITVSIIILETPKKARLAFLRHNVASLKKIAASAIAVGQAANCELPPLIRPFAMKHCQRAHVTFHHGNNSVFYNVQMFLYWQLF